MNEAGAVLRIARLDAADTARWDAFVVAHADGTFFHLAAWCEVLQRAFGIGHDHLYAERGGEIVAVLPLARVRSRLFGDRLLSTPFCVYGGAIGEPDACRQPGCPVVVYAFDLHQPRGAYRIQLRCQPLRAIVV